MILVFGILSLFTVPFVFGPIAWSMGNRDLGKMHAGQMDREGQAMTEAGRVCGMIATFIFVIVPLVLVLPFFCCGGWILYGH
jgi:hypothetical protein